ncbi:unannotated protein [freshwater metagenome]|uniref:Unannotated protein n=1 Tax=freshwater metagenome TaxID=449393 RepID=A0A6J6Q8R2_9ZZZZ
MVHAHGNDLVDWFSIGTPVPFANAHDPTSVRGESAVGVAIAVMFGRFRSQRSWRRSPRSQSIEALVGPIHEHNIGTMQPPRTTAVFMHASARTESVRKDINRSAARMMADQLHPPTLFGSSLTPPNIVATDKDLADRDRLGNDEISGDRRRPRTERRSCHRLVNCSLLRVPLCGRCLRRCQHH